MPKELLDIHKQSGLIDAGYEQPYFRTLKDFDRHSPRAYRATGEPFGGLFRIVMESTGNDDLFYHWFKTTLATHGMIEFYSSKDEDLPFRRLEFWDGWISELSETMTSTGSIPMLLYCEISPATVRYNKSLVFQKNWFITDINQKQVKEKSEEKEIVSVQWIDRDT
ncbi:MAG: hypothetical protein LBJ63_09880, partial [Prevotellaceae bacterium]|nr:hypothetical protein [Prevotellaceae bacterium]